MSEKERIEPLERCKDCDTVLVFRDHEKGVYIRFTAHDDEFCKTGMRIRLNAMEYALRSAHEERNLALHRLYASVARERRR